jgi:hypothetical protein
MNIFVEKNHAVNDAPERKISIDGQYAFGLIEKSEIVYDLDDSIICPQYN